MTELHNTNCVEKSLKTKAQKEINTEVIQLSNDATVIMMKIEKESNQTNLLMTP